MARRLAAPPPGLFRDVALAPDRERVPDALPVVAVHEDDPPAYRAEVEKRAVGRYPLQRRGVAHGELVELAREGLTPPRPRRRRRETIERERWVAARPVFLPASESTPRLDRRRADELLRRLASPAGLRGYLDELAPRLAPRFRVRAADAPLADPERDLARVLVAATAPDGTELAGDLWLKTGRLSTHADDRSLRLRVSFGDEGADDASRDEGRHALVAELARAVLPFAADVDADEERTGRLARHLGPGFVRTQHIAYWNAPGGGARFHHDAFDEPVEGGQRGVLYTQGTGRTVWLALSIEELWARVREVVAWMGEGDLPELREALGQGWREVQEASGRRSPALRELGRPDGGVFGPILNAPAFTSVLADAGHALVLRPGDALLLPSHGLERTAMHSVFAGSKGPGYALSEALRAGADSP